MTPLDELYEEAKALKMQVGPLFDGHTAFASMIVLAHIFANWMLLHDESEQQRMVDIFHHTAQDIYDELTGAEEMHH